MTEIFKNYKILIRERLNQFIKERCYDFFILNPWGKYTIEKLQEYISSGKMIRGGLILWSYQNTKKNLNNDIIDLALAYEFIQSGFLIHDDIMDRDKNRRGMDTIHFHYEKIGIEKNIKESSHFGISMGICAGDLCYFLASTIMINLKLSPLFLKKILNYITIEINRVVIAQMQDMYFGLSDYIPNIEEIMELYTYKTARYTFSVPLVIGALAAERSDEEVNLLEKIGEILGIIFQLKDDELGLFGNTIETGKPVGSDIIQKKKTLYYYYIFNSLPDNQLNIAKDIINKNNINEDDLQNLRKIIIENGIKEKINNKITFYINKLNELINNKKINNDEKNFIMKLYQYIIERNK